MKPKLTSLRVRMLLPVIIMTLFVVRLLTVLFSSVYITMILRQENEVNESGLETVSKAIAPLINTSISEARRIIADNRVTSYVSLQYASMAELVHARIACRDYLRGGKSIGTTESSGCCLCARTEVCSECSRRGTFFWMIRAGIRSREI